MVMKIPFATAIFTLSVSIAVAQRPLPFFHANDIIRFQGDSITDGGRQRTGSDFNHIMGQDYGYILAAEVGAKYPERKLTFVNRSGLLPVSKHKANNSAEMTEVRGRQAVVRRLAVKYHLPLIAYQDEFDHARFKIPAEHSSWYGVHPTYAGHGLMVEEWLRTTTAFWPDG
jgi:hypothetical protein